ncbi:PQQ-dependent sugar dehydrogenase [Thalassoroseus pseudoceratinae]|uniref:PQQ-dependent sugar dehydrogenase n=1 Tax=Thalassoroseus pseudoceratinae TaxID=2713176 RepID=UPI00141F7C74|nr:PQQ-dependent sugar dehydrogenase [Thalassoroseus pseudoceratinae]
MRDRVPQRRNSRRSSMSRSIEALEVRCLLSGTGLESTPEQDGSFPVANDVSPSGFSETVVVDGLSSPTAMQFAPDGKLFILEDAGTIEVWDGDTRVQADFLQNSPIDTQVFSERGLLGITFDPDYETNRFVYLYYTTTDADNHNRVSRFTANATGDLALAGSEQVITELDPHSAGNHNGGALHFGSDGMLYIATGDNAQPANAQSLTNRHGKLLRVDVRGDDFPDDDGQNFRVPADNPTTFDGIDGTTSGVNRAIWAVGLRNPFTFAVQPETGRIFINDVGQNTFEEINEGGAGLNYGWPATEGNFSSTQFPDFANPFYAYDHGGTSPNGCAITGGVFYNPETLQFPGEYEGDYFFADFCESTMWRIDLTTREVDQFASDLGNPVDLKIDDDGNLYVLSRSRGQVRRFSFGNAPPSITNQPDSQTVTIGFDATFTVSATGGSPLSFQWQRAESGTTNWQNIPGETNPTITLMDIQNDDDGDLFRVVVTDDLDRTVISEAATLSVTENEPPTATIIIESGFQNRRFTAGVEISFRGEATDSADGDLNPEGFEWRVDYLTTIDGGDADNDGLPGITRPFLSSSEIGGVASSQFTPATISPYTLNDVAYVITLTVEDSAGLRDVEQMVIEPNLRSVMLTTVPEGLDVIFNGQTLTTPADFVAIDGFEYELSTPQNQVAGGMSLTFDEWSDDGERTHTVTPRPEGLNLTATFLATGDANPLAETTDAVIDPATINGQYTHIATGNFDGIGLEDQFFWDPVSGQNRFVLGDGTVLTNYFVPTSLNGNDFTVLVSGRYDRVDQDMLFFWNPTTGRNRFGHLFQLELSRGIVTTNVIDPSAINNDFTQAVSGRLGRNEYDSLFFWNPATGRNRIVHVRSTTSNAPAGISNIQTNVIPPPAVNGNDYQTVRVGNFAGVGTSLLFFNLQNGANRRIDVSESMTVDEAQLIDIVSNVIAPTAINGGVYPQILVGDFDGNGFDDLFFGDPLQGRNRLFLRNDDADNGLFELLDNPASPAAINGAGNGRFVTIEAPSPTQADDLFFWIPELGTNRLATTV